MNVMAKDSEEFAGFGRYAGPATLILASLADEAKTGGRQSISTEVRGIAVDVGRSIVEKLTGAVPDAAKMAAAVDSSLSGRAH